MNTSLNAFEAQIAEIKAHINTLEDAQTLMVQTRTSTPPAAISETLNKILARRNEEKKYEYRANIVSLYGVFERFVEDLIREYVGDISRICGSYDNLDEKIKGSYVEKWKTLHTNIVKGHTKYSLTIVKMAQNMHDTILQNSSIIMPECFIPIGGNYRHDVVCNCMADLGATNIKSGMKKYEPLNTYIVNHGIVEDNIDESINLKLGDLVDRRNEVAHGAIGTMLGKEEYEEMMEFTVLYARTINGYMNDELKRVEWDLYSMVSAFSPFHLYHNNTVAAFHVENVSIKNGQRYLIKWPQGRYPRYSEKTVIELHTELADGSSSKVDEVNATTDTVISVDCGLAVSDGCEFKFL